MFRLLNSEEAGVCLKMSEADVNGLMHSGVLPYIALPGGIARFRFEDLRAYAVAVTLQVA